MKTKNKIWIYPLAIMGMFLVLTSSCKKTDNNSTKDSTTISKWVELGGTNTSSFNGGIRSIATDASGNVYAAGDFYNNNGKMYVAKWDKSTNSWGELGGTDTSSFNGGIYGPVATDVSGNVYACGVTVIPLHNGDSHVAQWNKNTNTWSELGGTGQPSFNGELRCIITDASGNVYAAGEYVDWNNYNNDKIFVARWDKSTNSWSVLGSSFNNFIFVIHTDASGSLYAGGEFVNANFSPYVAIWDGSNWSELGGANASNFGTGSISAITTDVSGNVYAAGFFGDGININNVAKWNKNTNAWSFLSGMNPPYSVSSITADVSGIIYAGGDFYHMSSGIKYVAKWNGTEWSDFGNLNANGSIYSICIDATGNIYAGGEFTNGKNNPYVAVYYK